MTDPHPVVRPEILLAQHEWIRRVARALVADEHLAADLEQELWVDVLERPPRVRGSLRGWLATALRNNLLNRRRAETRRVHREEVSSRPEAEESATDIVARAEAHRRVVDAVLALEEPYRSTVLFRFFEDLEPGEIARRQGIPVETVRTRLKRALAALRDRFAARDGEDGKPWLLLLQARDPADAPGPGIPVSWAAVAGGALMASKTLAAAVGVVAILALGWFTLRPAAEAPVPTPIVARVARPVRAPEAVPAPTPAPVPVPEPEIQDPLPPPAPSPEPPPPEPVEMPLLVLTGTVRSTDGLPIEGALVSIDLDSFRLRGRDGMPLPKDVVEGARPTAKSATTGADGSYSVQVRLPYDIAFSVVASAERFLPAEWGVVAIMENLARPMDIVLERAVGIEGRVVDQEGAPVSGASVFLWERRYLSKPSETKTNYDGRFVLPDASAGAWTLDVQGGRLRNGVKWKARSHGRVVHGGDRNLEIVLEHSPLKGARVLLEVVDGSNGEPVETAESSLVPTEGEPLEWTARDSGIQASKGSLRIDIVEPGKWNAWVRLQDGRIGWARFDVAAGDTEVRGRIEVGGTGSIGGKVDLRGLVLGPRDRLQVDVRFQESRAYPSFVMNGDGRGGEISGHAWVNDDGTFVVKGFLNEKGLLPGRYEVHAWTRGISALGDVEVRSNRRATVDLAATKTGTLRFRLDRALPPCKLEVVLFRPSSAQSVMAFGSEKPFESEWTESQEFHPGDYSWRARFENPADRHSLVRAARPASGTVTVKSGETVEVVIPVVKEGD